MRLYGYCKSCRRIRLVSVSGHALATARASGAVEGTCSKCERVEQAEASFRRYGFKLRYVDYCEDARTPGLLGQIRGVTDWERREVKISRRANPTPAKLAEILEHELHHVRDPDWDCGSRDVLGRGGPR